jgi:hypothetical protein
MILVDLAEVEPLLRDGCTHELDASRPLADLAAIASPDDDVLGGPRFEVHS